jgi:hypothetical protein
VNSRGYSGSEITNNYQRQFYNENDYIVCELLLCPKDTVVDEISPTWPQFGYIPQPLGDYLLKAPFEPWLYPDQYPNTQYRYWPSPWIRVETD